MMNRGSFFGDFDNDPFFDMHRDRTHHFNEFFHGGFPSDPFMALTDGRDRDRDGHHRHRNDYSRSRQVEPHHSRNQDMMPAGSSFNPFGFMNSMMSNMHGMMENAFRQMDNVHNDPNTHSYMQSSVMSYSNMGEGQPKIYQATKSSRQAPGGIKETHKAVRDSEAGIEKMAIGRHLNDRGHIVTRQRNTRTGDMDENQDFQNLDESEAPQFNEEWKQRTSHYASRRHDPVGYDSHTRHRPVEDHRYRPDARSRDYYTGRGGSNKHKAIEQGRPVEKAF